MAEGSSRREMNGSGMAVLVPSKPGSGPQVDVLTPIPICQNSACHSGVCHVQETSISATPNPTPPGRSHKGSIGPFLPVACASFSTAKELAMVSCASSPERWKEWTSSAFMHKRRGSSRDVRVAWCWPGPPRPYAILNISSHCVLSAGVWFHGSSSSYRTRRGAPADAALNP